MRIILSIIALFSAGGLLAQEYVPTCGRELPRSRVTVYPTAQEAAAAAGMGLTTFKRLFRQTTGSSWAAYLTARRMREAQRLLAVGSTVEEAAPMAAMPPTPWATAPPRASQQPLRVSAACLPVNGGPQIA